MRRRVSTAIYVVMVSIFLTAVQPCFAGLACSDLYTSTYSVETQQLVRLFDEKMSAEDQGRFRSRWQQIDLSLRNKKLSWENIVKESETNQSVADKMTEINGFRIGSSNSFRAEPAKVFEVWWAADRLLAELSPSKEFISLESFKRVNHLLNNNREDGSPGVFRSREYWDDFLPLASNDKFRSFKATEVETGLNELVSWYQTYKEQLHPIELAAQFAQRFITIHPFKDGNGRTARLFMDRILILHGYLPSASMDSAFMRSVNDNDTSVVQAVEAVTAGIEKSVIIINSP